MNTTIKSLKDAHSKATLVQLTAELDNFYGLCSDEDLAAARLAADKTHAALKSACDVLRVSWPY